MFISPTIIFRGYPTAQPGKKESHINSPITFQWVTKLYNYVKIETITAIQKP